MGQISDGRERLDLEGVRTAWNRSLRIFPSSSVSPGLRKLSAGNESKNTMLTIAEELVLLLLNEEDGSMIPLQEGAVECALAGAVLMDLAFAYRIDTDLQSLVVNDATPTGNAMSDLVLTKVASRREELETQAWVRELSVDGATSIRELALASLVERGILERREKRIPRSFGSPYRLIDPDGARVIKRRIKGVFAFRRYPRLPRDRLDLPGAGLQHPSRAFPRSGSRACRPADRTTAQDGFDRTRGFEFDRQNRAQHHAGGPRANYAVPESAADSIRRRWSVRGRNDSGAACPYSGPTRADTCRTPMVRRTLATVVRLPASGIERCRAGRSVVDEIAAGDSTGRLPRVADRPCRVRRLLSARPLRPYRFPSRRKSQRCTYGLLPRGAALRRTLRSLDRQIDVSQKHRDCPGEQVSAGGDEAACRPALSIAGSCHHPCSHRLSPLMRWAGDTQGILRDRLGAGDSSRRRVGVDLDAHRQRKVHTPGRPKHGCTQPNRNGLRVLPCGAGFRRCEGSGEGDEHRLPQLSRE